MRTGADKLQADRLILARMVGFRYVCGLRLHWGLFLFVMKRRRRHWTWEDGVQGVTILETLSNETQHAHTSVRGTGKHRIELGETIKCI